MWHFCTSHAENCLHVYIIVCTVDCTECTVDSKLEEQYCSNAFTTAWDCVRCRHICSCLLFLQGHSNLSVQPFAQGLQHKELNALFSLKRDKSTIQQTLVQSLRPVKLESNRHTLF